MGNFIETVRVAGASDNYKSVVKVANASEIGNAVSVAALPSASASLKGLIYYLTSDSKFYFVNAAGDTWTELGAGSSGCLQTVVVADEDDPTTELVDYGGTPGEMVRVYEDKSPALTLSSTYYKLPTTWTVGAFTFEPYVCASDDPEYVWISSYGVYSYLGTILANQAQFLGPVTCTASLTVSGGACVVPAPTASTHAARHGQILTLDSQATYLLYKDDPGLVAGSGYVFDSLTDQTGIDDTASTGEAYDAGNDLYTNAGTGASDSWERTLDTDQGASLGGYSIRHEIPAANISASGTSIRATFVAHSTEALVVSHASIVEQDSGANGTTTPTEITFDGGSSGFSISGGETKVSDFVAFALDETKTYLLIVDYTNTGMENRPKRDSGGATTYYSTSDTSWNDQTVVGYSGGTNIQGISKIEVSADYENMVLVTEDFTATAQPTYARPAVFLEPLEAMTVNTDFKLYASRDGGTTWNQATLALIGTYGDVLLYAADATLTSTGTTMKWKLETLNLKRLNCHALGLSWR